MTWPAPPGRRYFARGNRPTYAPGPQILDTFPRDEGRGAADRNKLRSSCEFQFSFRFCRFNPINRYRGLRLFSPTGQVEPICPLTRTRRIKTCHQPDKKPLYPRPSLRDASANPMLIDFAVAGLAWLCRILLVLALISDSCILFGRSPPQIGEANPGQLPRRRGKQVFHILTPGKVSIASLTTGARPGPKVILTSAANGGSESMIKS